MLPKLESLNLLENVFQSIVKFMFYKLNVQSSMGFAIYIYFFLNEKSHVMVRDVKYVIHA